MKLKPKTELDCLAVGSPEQRRQCAAPRGDLRYAVLAERQWRREAWAEYQHVKSVKRLERETAEAQREWDRPHRNFKVKREVSWGKEKGMGVPRHVLHRVIPTHSSGGALPRYSHALTDKAGRLFVFQRIRYYSSRNSKQGRGADAARYAMKGAHVLGDGRDCISSNVGDTFEEIVAGMDVAEGVNRTVSLDAKTLFHGIMQSCHDLTPEQQLELARDYAEYVFGRQQLPYLVVLHPPSADGDQRNWHVHILYSLRPMTKIGEGEWAVGKYLRTDLDTPEQFSRLRFLWAEALNHACEEAGVPKRYTHLSYAAAGVDFIPQTHLGEGLTAKVRRGERSAINEANHRIAMRNSMVLAVRDLRAKLLATVSETRGVVERLHRAATLALNVSATSNDELSRLGAWKALDDRAAIPTGPTSVNDNDTSMDLMIGGHSDALPSGIENSVSITSPSLKLKALENETIPDLSTAINGRMTLPARPLKIDYRPPAICPAQVCTAELFQQIAVSKPLPRVISPPTKHSFLTRISLSVLSIPKALSFSKPAKTGLARLQLETSLPRSPAPRGTEIKSCAATLHAAYDRNLPAGPQASPPVVPMAQILPERSSIPSVASRNDEHTVLTLRSRGIDHRTPKGVGSIVDAQPVKTGDGATKAFAKGDASPAASEALSSQTGPVRIQTTEEKQPVPVPSGSNEDASNRKSSPVIRTDRNTASQDSSIETAPIANPVRRDFIRSRQQERDEEEKRKPIHKPNSEAIRLAAETFRARQLLLGILEQERHVITKDVEGRVVLSAALLQRAELLPEQITDPKMQDRLARLQARNQLELQEMAGQTCEELRFGEGFWRPSHPSSAEVFDLFRRWQNCPEVQEALRRTHLLTSGADHTNEQDPEEKLFLRLLLRQGADGKGLSKASSDRAAASRPIGPWPIDIGHGG